MTFTQNKQKFFTVNFFPLTYIVGIAITEIFIFVFIILLQLTIKVYHFQIKIYYFFINIFFIRWN